MKVAIGIIALVLALIGGAVGVFYYSADIYSNIHDSLDALEKAVENDDWDKAMQESETLEELWNRGDLIWSAVMDHGQVDRVDESIIQVIAMVKQQSKDDLLVEISLAKRLVDRLQESETPHFRSIF